MCLNKHDSVCLEYILDASLHQQWPQEASHSALCSVVRWSNEALKGQTDAPVEVEALRWTVCAQNKKIIAAWLSDEAQFPKGLEKLEYTIMSIEIEF